MSTYRNKYTVDRYIPNRAYINSEFAQYNYLARSNECLSSTLIEQRLLNEPFINTAKYANVVTNYRKQLQHALFETPHSSKKKSHKIIPERDTWPVVARKKPLIERPVTILDMPDISTTIYHHVIDWGKHGRLATIFHEEVHLWPSLDNQPTKTDTGGTILECVKWNRSGTKFAVSRTISGLSIMDGETLKLVASYPCKCPMECHITSIAWTEKDNVIAGCSRGCISIISKNSPTVVYCRPNILRDEIIDIKLSCNDNYLVLRGMKGTCAIFKMPVEEAKDPWLTFNKNRGFIKTTAWHPWKESILVVGDLQNSITIWNVNSEKLIDRANPRPLFKEPYTLDCLTFNPLSAELLVSFYCEDADQDSSLGYNFLSIFSNIQTIVDEVKFHNARVPFALWDGTGTKLATASADENLAIWNFYGDQSSEFQSLRPKKKEKSIFDIFESEKKFKISLR
ncbi:protein cortex-like [Sitophilus oryzae]|uniref:Protein cortex-like n=1 Tax=Sitophilus oryzae TaxID=7048 RepID=A0A6J2YHP9_SITOR|nr:protein cortex-like [Sitophilus oryzae]